MGRAPPATAPVRIVPEEQARQHRSKLNWAN